MSDKYVVIKKDLVTGRVDAVEEFTDPALAYSLASELHAIAEVGDDADRENFDLNLGHKYLIGIEDQEGNDVWGECSRARCPSVGLFQCKLTQNQ